MFDLPFWGPLAPVVIAVVNALDWLGVCGDAQRRPGVGLAVRRAQPALAVGHPAALRR